MPTPKALDGVNELEDDVNWGKFEPAIRRWEAVIGRPAPAPTLPDGKEGAHRLSPWFTEWMMGLPEGWICDPEIGLTRNEQLKACGNGVVPQQAELALRILLEGVDFSLGGGASEPADSDS
jgi:DNA (cytosine-5)-methyltransferase 1